MERCILLGRMLSKDTASMRSLGSSWLLTAVLMNGEQFNSCICPQLAFPLSSREARISKHEDCMTEPIKSLTIEGKMWGINKNDFWHYENDRIIASVGGFTKIIVRYIEIDSHSPPRPLLRPPRTYAIPPSPPGMGPDTSETFNVPLPQGFPPNLFAGFTAIPEASERTQTSINANGSSWCLAHNLTSKRASEYLTSGEWCGYYVDDREMGVLGAMLEVFFSTSDNPATLTASEFALALESFHSDVMVVNALLYIKAKGHDHVGKFKLLGILDKSGHLSMEKRYYDGPTWKWECCLTPFGIFGVWGEVPTRLRRRSRGPSLHGLVWLWKREWSDEGAGDGPQT